MTEIAEVSTVESFHQWIEHHKIAVTNYSFDNTFNVNGIEDVFLLLDDTDKELVINSDFELVLTLEEEQKENIDYYVVKIGESFYYSKTVKIKKLVKFLHVGESTESIHYPFLGIHGRSELCSGSKDYVDWITKASFLGIKTLGICERNTLAGVYTFQEKCIEKGIKPIIGYECVVRLSNKINTGVVKLYVKNNTGWKNLLKIHEIVTINKGIIQEDQISKLSCGLFVIIDKKVLFDSPFFENAFHIFSGCEKLFYQIDPVEWSNGYEDYQHLMNIKEFSDKQIWKRIDPILIHDAYYLDQEDYIVRDFLSFISKQKYLESKDQYFCPLSNLASTFLNFYADEAIEYGESIFMKAYESLEYIESSSSFILTYGKGKFYLPKYKMNEEEQQQYATTYDLFYDLIERGFLKKVVKRKKDIDVYYKRLEKELAVLEEGGVIDYFLILWDINNYIVKRGGIPGLGRGSSAGSLVSYLLGIVHVDPIEYNLIFERFLNKARLLGGSLPDIDQDIPSNLRGDVIEYLVNKYGRNNVTAVGTSQKFMLKSSLKDVLKYVGMEFKEANYITSLLTKDYDKSDITGFFDLVTRDGRFRDLLNKYPTLPDLIQTVIFQPRSYGQHAAAIVIVPDQDEEGNITTAWDYLPLRLTDDGQFVTEWEKETVETAGFLKNDLLGLTQLDKFMLINKFIGKNIDITKIIPDDDAVFELFREGSTEDVFQFNSAIQKKYSKDLQPESIEHLIAANALLRPGTMESNTHNMYLPLRHGQKEQEMPPLLEEFLSETYGLIVYQEQCMMAYQTITECDLEESDNFRKVITKSKPGKKDPKLDKYEVTFKECYMNKIHDEAIVNKTWDTIMAFAAYSFNIAHSTAYAMTAYVSQWYKCYYPVEFYTTALTYADEKTLSNIIQEILSKKQIRLKGPDVNLSLNSYTFDKDNSEIYTSLISIKGLGNSAYEKIIADRNTKGNYYSFEEFLKRVKVGKGVIQSMILSGCFDKIENINKESERRYLLIEYLKSIKEKVSEDYTSHSALSNVWWQMKQKQLCGWAEIDFKSAAKQLNLKFPYLSGADLKNQNKDQENMHCVSSGVIEDIVERKSAKGQFGILKVSQGESSFSFLLWNEAYKKFKDRLSKGLFIVFAGSTKYDSYREEMAIASSYNTTIEFL